MPEIRHLENRHDVIFFCRWWSDLDKISQTGAEWHVDCGDMVEIETRFRIPIWLTFWQIKWHVIPEPRITLQGAANWWIHCHDSRATCHIAGCKNSIRCNENRFFLPYFILFLFFNAVWSLTRAAFVSSPIYPCRFLSERCYVTFTLCRRKSVCRLSVCDVVALYLEIWTFRQYFCAIHVLVILTVCIKILGKNSKGSRWSCKLNRREVWKIGVFDRYIAVFRKQYKIRPIVVQWKSNRISYAIYPHNS